jgi:hypothetical protein
MDIVPRGLDEHAAQMRVPVLVMVPSARLVPLECSEGTSPTKATRAGAPGKAAGVAEFGGDREG